MQTWKPWTWELWTVDSGPLAAPIAGKQEALTIIFLAIKIVAAWKMILQATLTLWNKGPPNWGCDGQPVAKLCGLPASSHEDPATMKDNFQVHGNHFRRRLCTLLAYEGQWHILDQSQTSPSSRKLEHGHHQHGAWTLEEIQAERLLGHKARQNITGLAKH